MYKRILSVVICSLIVLSGFSNTAFALGNLSFEDISIEPIGAVTRNLTLITKYNGEETYTWHSDKPDVISAQTGVVNRPLVGMDDEVVRLTVTANGSSEYYDVTVKAFSNNQELLEKAKDALDFSDLSMQPINAVTENLTLPGSWNYDSSIYWTSSNESVIAINDGAGVVKRPSYGEGISNVLLTANIIYGNDFVSKYFLVKVKEQEISYPVSTVLNSVCDSFENSFLSIQSIIDLRSDLIIPQSSHTDVVISCKSSNPEVISDDGVITRSAADSIALFTVTFKMGYEQTKRSFPIVVKAVEQDSILLDVEADVDSVIAKLRQNHNLERLTENLSLPSVGERGTHLSYSSSNVQALSTNGEIIRGESSQNVVLTVIGTNNGETVSKTVSITIPAQSINTQQGGLTDSGSGSGGGGGSAGEVKMYAEQQIISNDTTFKDVPKAHWAYSAIEYLYNAKIVTGMGDSIFAPDALVTREQMVKMLVDALPNINVSNYENTFEDVVLDAWYAKYIGTAHYYSLVNGISETYFGVGNPITRQDMAVMIYNTLSSMEKSFAAKDNSGTFTDFEQVSEYAKNAVNELKKYALVSGRGSNMYYPKETLTRAEAATIIYRMLTY